MRALGLITARGGSKAIPQKNLVPLGGRPLLSYTADAAINSRCLSRVVVSTDDAAIAEVAIDHGLEVPFERPAELATDDTPSLPVVQHALRWLTEQEGWTADCVVLLQPTSPLRQSRHIDEAIQLFEHSGVDTVVSVVEVPHRFSPYSLMKLEGDRLEHLWEGPSDFDRFRRQELPQLYARNGPAVLVTRCSTVLSENSLYGEKIAPFVMRDDESIDIDTPLDLLIAEALLLAKGRN